RQRVLAALRAKHRLRILCSDHLRQDRSCHLGSNLLRTQARGLQLVRLEANSPHRRRTGLTKGRILIPRTALGPTSKTLIPTIRGSASTNAPTEQKLQHLHKRAHFPTATAVSIVPDCSRRFPIRKLSTDSQIFFT